MAESTPVVQPKAPASSMTYLLAAMLVTVKLPDVEVWFSPPLTKCVADVGLALAKGAAAAKATTGTAHAAVAMTLLRLIP